jgi:hypothetical protein
VSLEEVMAKETSPAFQFYPRDFLSDENVAMMTYPELGMYWKLCCHCWLEGSIPGDLGGIARLLRIQPADLESAWGIIGKCFVVSRKLEGRLVQPRLERERDKQKYFRKLKSEQGKEGAKRRWNSHKTNKKNGRAIVSPMANDSSSSSSSTSVGSAIASAMATPSSAESGVFKTEIGEVHRLPGAEKRARPPDVAFELWAGAFERARSVPYGKGSSNDFTKLAGLRSRLKIGTRDTPKEWRLAIVNYLTTPMGKRTLADLCDRYDVFLNGKLNEYGKPDRGTHDANTQTLSKFVERHK